MTSSSLVLKPFIDFAEAGQAEWITTDLFLKWKDAFGSANARTWATRLGAVRSFAKWLQAIDERNEVPPKGLIARQGTRPRPCICSDAEIGQIITAAAALASKSGLRGATFSTLFGLIAATGLRIGEALGLDDSDVDAHGATLHIRHARNGGRRIIPVTPCVIAKLQDYRQCRDRITPGGCGALLQAETGERSSIHNAEYNFAKVGQAIRLREPAPGNGHGPRIHDLRHTMATRTIIGWFREGQEVDANLYKLSAWLGHKHPAGSWWYIEAVPELLALVSERGARTSGNGGAP